MKKVWIDQFPDEAMAIDIIFNVNNSDTLIVLAFSLTAAVVVAISLLIEIKLWSEINVNEERDNSRKSNNKETKTNISRKKTP